jgi:hypothetical protein
MSSENDSMISEAVVQEKLYLAASSALDASMDEKVRPADRAALIEAACKATREAQCMTRDELYNVAEDRRSRLLDQISDAVPLFLAGLAKQSGVDLGGGTVSPLRPVPPPPPVGPSVPTPG